MMGMAPAYAGFMVALLFTAGVWLAAGLLPGSQSTGNRQQTLLWVLLFGFTISAMLASYILGYRYPEYVARFTYESHVVEWTTFWVAIAAASSAGIALYRSLGNQVNLLALGFLLLGIFIAGEEIAWGQHLRVVDVSPSEFFQAHNKQNEITLHNLDIGDDIIIWAQACAPIALIIGFLLLQRHSKTVVRYCGFEFHPRVALLAVLFGLYFFHNAYPFEQDVLDAGVNIPWSQLLTTIPISHSSSQSEIAECLFAGLLLISAVALVFAGSKRAD